MTPRAIIYGRPGCTGCEDAQRRFAALGFTVEFVNLDEDCDALAHLSLRDRPLDELPQVELMLGPNDALGVLAGCEKINGEWQTGRPE